jgi:hypothetical protein
MPQKCFILCAEYIVLCVGSFDGDMSLILFNFDLYVTVFVQQIYCIHDANAILMLKI